MTSPRNSHYGIPIFCAFLLSISVFSKHAASQAPIPDRYYTAPPDSLINEMRQTPRPRTGMNLTQLIELEGTVLPRALACESIFYDNPRMQERVKAWPQAQQVGLANECRRIIADSNAMQEQLKRLRQAEQEQLKRAQQAQAAQKAEEARKAEETRVAEQRAAFMARQPDFLLILNARARQFEVTKSLEGKNVITQKARPVVVDFVRSSAQSSGILIERYEKLPPALITELKASVTELAKRNGLTVQTRGLEVREVRLQPARKCVGQAASQTNQRTASPNAGAASSPLDRVCPDLTLGLIDRVELGRIRPLIDRGDILIVGEIRYAELQARIDAAAQKAAEAAAAEEASRKQTLA